MPQYDDVPRFDVARVRADFPILDREINGHPLVYLDSANTSHKPRQVLDVLAEHYARHNANVSRSVHTLGTEATEAYEGARAKIAAFINAPSVGRGGVHQELHRGDQHRGVRLLQRLAARRTPTRGSGSAPATRW